MSPDAWTVVATQLITTLGIVYFLVQRMDQLGRDLRQDLGARIDANRSDLGARIGASRSDLGARVDASGPRFDRLELHIDRLETDLGGRIDAQGARIDAHIERHAS